MEKFNKARPKKKFNDGSLSLPASDDSDDSNNPVKLNNTIDAYNPSKLNDLLRSHALNHHNVAHDNLLIIENGGNSNCIYLSIRY